MMDLYKFNPFTNRGKEAKTSSEIQYTKDWLIIIPKIKEEIKRIKKEVKEGKRKLVDNSNELLL